MSEMLQTLLFCAQSLVQTAIGLKKSKTWVMQKTLKMMAEMKCCHEGLPVNMHLSAA